MAALTIAALSGAITEASAGEFAKHLRTLDPAARVGGESIVGTRPGQQLQGVHGRPNFIAALGDGETIHGTSINDELGAGPHAEDVKIIAPAKGHSLIVGGPRSKIIVSGKGHNLIYSHAAGATIVLKSPGNEVIADGPHDKIVCGSHASHELIEVARGVRVSRTCKGHHNDIEPAPAFPPRARSSATRAHASQWVRGSGTYEDPYRTDLCDETNPGSNGCSVSFIPRTLTGFWANEEVPSYACPQYFFLLNRNYAPAGTTLPPGVEVQGLGPIGVSITAVWETGGSAAEVGGTMDVDLANRTATGNGLSSATNWTTGSASYRVILHCTTDRASGYVPPNIGIR